MSAEFVFEAWPKIARLNREIVVTEKIDGTNAAVLIDEDLNVGAQSRSRLITPEQDNYGFARWTQDNAEALASLLGPGRHFGEWWGQGIQRRYGLDEKRFSLFNTARHTGQDYSELPQLRVVPILYQGPFSQEAIEAALQSLAEDGSAAAPGFLDPEGVCVFHAASRALYKVTLKNDEQPKSVAS